MARQINIVIEEGCDFSRELQVLDEDGAAIDITNDTFEAVLADGPAGPIWAEFTVTKTTPAAGRFTLSLTASQTAGPFPRELAFQVKRTTAGGSVFRTHEGPAQVRPEITR